MMIRCLLLLALLTSVYGCSIEKRLYRKGWAVSSSHNFRLKHDKPGIDRELNNAEPARSDVAGEELQPVAEIRDQTTDLVAVSSLDSLQPILSEEAVYLPDTIFPGQEADTVYMTPKEFKRWRKINHLPWTKHEKAQVLYIVAGLLVLAIIGAVVLVIASGSTFGGEVVLALFLLLLALILLIVLIVVAGSTTYESMLKKQERDELRENERREELGDELSEEEKDAVIDEESAAKKQRNKLKAGIFFGLILVVFAGILLLQP